MPRKHRINTIIDDEDEQVPGPSHSQTQGRRRRVNDDEISLAPSQTQKSQGRKKSGRSLTQNSTLYEDDDLSQSQISQSRSQKNLSDDELNRLMGHVVRYLLVSDRSRHPILRQNIQKNVLNNSKHYRTVMDLAKSTLKKVFGYELVDLDNAKYILVNEVPNIDNHISFPTERSQMVLLFLCLSHIFMNDEVCTEDNLYNFLRKLNIIDGDCFRHDYFGDVVHLISSEFVKQRYLLQSKIENSDPQKFQYQWGARAERELDKLEVLKFVSKIYRNKSIQDWASQFKIAEQNKSNNTDP